MVARIVVLCLLAALPFSVPGCAARQAPEYQARYYPECYDPIDRLCKEQSNRAETKGTMVGGLIGALGGALIGGLSTGKLEGALIGAAAGAATGALTGFFSARLGKIKDQDQRLAEYQTVLGEQAQGWDLERASVERAYKCYGEQINVLQAAWKSRQISREEFRARMLEIREGINYINTYWAQAQTRMDEALADGDKWLAQEDAAAAQAKRPVQAASQIQRQKRNTAMARKSNTVANNRVNETRANVELACNRLLEAHEGLAELELFLAMS